MMTRTIRVTPAERRWLLRRRANLSQQAAVRAGRASSVEVLARGERSVMTDFGCAERPRLKLRVSYTEWARLERRRAGLSLAQAAAMLGVSRVSYLRAERDDPRRVLLRIGEYRRTGM